MEIKPYWIQFLPLNSNWYVLLGVLYGVIGFCGLCCNFLVIFYFPLFYQNTLNLKNPNTFTFKSQFLV